MFKIQHNNLKYYIHNNVDSKKLNNNNKINTIYLVNYSNNI